MRERLFRLREEMVRFKKAKVFFVCMYAMCVCVCVCVYSGQMVMLKVKTSYLIEG